MKKGKNSIKQKSEQSKCYLPVLVKVGRLPVSLCHDRVASVDAPATGRAVDDLEKRPVRRKTYLQHTRSSTCAMNSGSCPPSRGCSFTLFSVWLPAVLALALVGAYFALGHDVVRIEAARLHLARQNRML